MTSCRAGDRGWLLVRRTAVAFAAHDVHAVVACGPVEDHAVGSLLVRILAWVTEPTVGGSRSAPAW